MKRDHRPVTSSAVLAVAVAVAAALLTACTLIGGGLGALIDKSGRRRPAAPVSAWEIEKVEKGTLVGVRLRDGSTVLGHYDGLAVVPLDRYTTAYDWTRQGLADPASIPALGAGASIRGAGGGESACELVAFLPGVIQARLPGRPDVSQLALANTAQIVDREGHVYTREALAGLLDSGRIPVRQEATVVTASGRERVSLQDIALIEMPEGARRGGAKKAGLVVGALVDAGIIIALIADATKPEPPPCTGEYCNSCPFVYSFDGRGFVLDAEPFGGSFVEVAQRTDWVRLDHLREVGGTYRLRVKAELPEREHLDAVKLLVVDHPPGTEVVPDLYGGLHALSGPAAPSGARDLRGAEVRDFVARSDGRVWASNPFRRDPADPADRRDGVVLEFPRPADARSATLSLRARSTLWFPALLRHVLGLPGRHLEAWYAGLAADPGAQRSLLVFAGEAFPTIRLWTGEAWKPIELLGELPIRTYGVQAVRLDLAKVSGSVVRVRIDGIPGTWLLDSARLDFSAEASVDVTELAAASARRSDGRDVRDALLRVDRTRHTMATGDTLEMTFTAPPRPAGRERSFVLQATGYYTILVPGSGEPQTARFERILGTPGALAQYSAELSADEQRLVVARAR